MFKIERTSASYRPTSIVCDHRTLNGKQLEGFCIYNDKGIVHRSSNSYPTIGLPSLANNGTAYMASGDLAAIIAVNDVLRLARTEDLSRGDFFVMSEAGKYWLYIPDQHLRFVRDEVSLHYRAVGANNYKVARYFEISGISIISSNPFISDRVYDSGLITFDGQSIRKLIQPEFNMVKAFKDKYQLSDELCKQIMYDYNIDGIRDIEHNEIEGDDSRYL